MVVIRSALVRGCLALWKWDLEVFLEVLRYKLSKKWSMRISKSVQKKKGLGQLTRKFGPPRDFWTNHKACIQPVGCQAISEAFPSPITLGSF